MINSVSEILIRPQGDRFRIIFDSERRFFSSFLDRKANLHCCYDLFWYYSYWHSFNVEKQRQRQREYEHTTAKKKQPVLLVDPRQKLELDYLLYIQTDLRTLARELNYHKDIINKTISLFLDHSVWGHTDHTGKAIGLLTDESYRKEQYHSEKILPFNPLIKRNRWLLFHPEIYNHYSAVLSTSDEWVKERNLEGWKFQMETAAIDRLVKEGWTSPAQSTRKQNPKNTKQELPNWSGFLSWAKTTLQKSRIKELESIDVEILNNQIVFKSDVSDFLQSVVKKHFEKENPQIAITF